MFNAEMKESVQSTIDIYDLRFATFAAIIEFIYTDDIPALTADNAMELYIAGIFTFESIIASWKTNGSHNIVVYFFLL